jgi:transposase
MLATKPHRRAVIDRQIAFDRRIPIKSVSLMPGAASISDRSGNSREVVRRARLLLQRAASAAELRAAQAVLFVDDYGLSLRQTAEMMGCSVPTVGRLRRWLKTTPPNEQVLHAHWGGRRRQNLSFAEEKRFLTTFKNQGRDGQGIAVKSIWQAYEAMLGRSVPDSTIYRLLQRHGWHNAARGAYQGKTSPASLRPLPRAPGRAHPSSRRNRAPDSS